MYSFAIILGTTATILASASLFTVATSYVRAVERIWNKSYYDKLELGIEFMTKELTDRNIKHLPEHEDTLEHYTAMCQLTQNLCSLDDHFYTLLNVISKERAKQLLNWYQSNLPQILHMWVAYNNLPVLSRVYFITNIYAMYTKKFLNDFATEENSADEEKEQNDTAHECFCGSCDTDKHPLFALLKVAEQVLNDLPAHDYINVGDAQNSSFTMW